MKRYFSLILFLLCSGMNFAQQTLGYDEFLDWVRYYHPVARQGDMTLELGKQELKMARGGFDPLLYGYQTEKSFQNTEYYNKKEAGVLVPTMAGVELRGIFEQNSGAYLNLEDNVPQNGLMALGASVNLGQGLLIDQRRASLRQAQIYAASTEEERKQILNNLYLDATRAYWAWAGGYADLMVHQEGLNLAQIRFEGIKSSYEQGDLPAIDTVEAYTQVLNRTIRLQEAENNYFSLTQDLNVFLWDEDQEPIFLNTQIIPIDLKEEMWEDIEIQHFRSLIARHPDLRLLDYDMEHLQIERRWRAEQLKPVVKVNYNFLAESFNGLENAPFFENNYKWGIQISTPLFLRRERGALGVTKARINMVQYNRDLQFQRLQAHLEKEYNTLLVLDKQVDTFEDNIVGLERLLEGERVRFDMGESSLFLINAREISLFDALLVLNSIYVQKNISFSRVRTAAGLGFEGL